MMVLPLAQRRFKEEKKRQIELEEKAALKRKQESRKNKPQQPDIDLSRFPTKASGKTTWHDFFEALGPFVVKRHVPVYRVSNRLVKHGMFLNRADFLRMAAREKLQQIQVLELRDVDRSQAKEEILAYLRQHPGAYPSDIGVALQLDLHLVMEVCRELLDGGRVEEVEGA